LVGEHGEEGLDLVVGEAARAQLLDQRRAAAHGARGEVAVAEEVQVVQLVEDLAFGAALGQRGAQRAGQRAPVVQADALRRAPRVQRLRRRQPPPVFAQRGEEVEQAIDHGAASSRRTAASAVAVSAMVTSCTRPRRSTTTSVGSAYTW